MENIIGYIIFVSYSKFEYKKNRILIDKMILEEFIKFNKNDTINRKTIIITPIYNTTDIKVCKTTKYDNAIYWYVSARFAKNELVSEFIEKYT